MLTLAAVISLACAITDQRADAAAAFQARAAQRVDTAAVAGGGDDGRVELFPVVAAAWS